MLYRLDGSTVGTIGGGQVEHDLWPHVEAVLETQAAQLVEYKLTADLAMCCGGTMTFFLDPVTPNKTLIVIGCGHVGSAIIRAAAPLDFELIAVDDLPGNATAERLPEASAWIPSYEPEDLAPLVIKPRPYVVIATREHAIDQRLIEFFLKLDLGFLGVIGSQRKAHMQQERLRAKGFCETDIARVVCPMGLEIGAETPEEIRQREKRESEKKRLEEEEKKLRELQEQLPF